MKIKILLILLLSILFISLNSNNVEAKLPAPTGFTATAGDSQVTLSWNAVTGAVEYNVYQEALGLYWIIGTVTTTNVKVIDLTNGNTYCFKVAAIDAEGGIGEQTDAACATPKDLTPPAVPTGLNAVVGELKVDLTWTANTESDLYGYYIYRNSGTGYIEYAWVDKNFCCSYSDTNVTSKTTYWYKISAVDTSFNESSASSAVSATPYQYILTPSGDIDILFGEEKTFKIVKDTDPTQVIFITAWKFIDVPEGKSLGAVEGIRDSQNNIIAIKLNTKDAILGSSGKIKLNNLDKYTTGLIRIVYNLAGRIRYVGRDDVSEEDVPAGTVLGLDDGDKTIPAQYSDDGFSFSNIFSVTPTIHAYSKKVIPYRIVVGDATLYEHNFEISPQMDDKDPASGNYRYYDPIKKEFKYNWVLGSNIGNRAGFNILKYAIMGYDYASPKGLTQDLNIVWYPGNKLDRSYYLSNTIHLQGGGNGQDSDEWDDSVILHEFGHFVHDKLAPHLYATAEQIGYVEGWANFYSSRVREEKYSDLGRFFVKVGTNWVEPVFTEPVYLGETGPRFLFYIETKADGGLWWATDTETSLKCNVSIPTNIWEDKNQSPPQGETDDWAVSASLWDIYDTNDENPADNTTIFKGITYKYNNDDLDGRMPSIWAAFTTNVPGTTHTPYTFLEFSKNWVSSYDNEVLYHNLCRAHGIDYTRPNVTEPIGTPTFYFNTTNRKMAKAEFKWDTGISPTVSAQKILISGPLNFEITIGADLRSYDLANYVFETGYWISDTYNFQICTQSPSATEFSCSSQKQFILTEDTSPPSTSNVYTDANKDPKTGLYHLKYNQFFINFSGTDTQSGINKFEVQWRWVTKTQQSPLTTFYIPTSSLSCAGTPNLITCSYLFKADELDEVLDTQNLNGYKFFFKIRGIDNVDNKEEFPAAQLSVLIDTKPPTAIDVTPEQGSYKSRAYLSSSECCGSTIVDEEGIVNKTSIKLNLKNIPTGEDYSNKVTYTFDETTGILSYKIDPTYLDGNLTNGELSDGIYQLKLEVSDLAGNIFSGVITEFTVDNHPPTSSVSMLPEYQNTLSFTVTWQGEDCNNVTSKENLKYDVQYKEKDEDFNLISDWKDWLINTSSTSETFNGVEGHRYYFRCRAIDEAENIENYPVSPDYDTYTYIDTQPPDISNLLVSEPYISPSTSPNIKDKTTISATVSDANPNDWKITIKDEVGNVVKEETFTLTTSSVQNISYEWNGTDKDNKFVKDGIYTFIIEVTDKVEHTKSVSFTVTIDNTPPVAHILFPYFSESSIQTIEAGMQIDIIGTAKDKNFKEYKIYHYAGIPDVNTNWGDAIYTSNKIIENSLLYKWDISALSEGIHSIKLIVEDKAGNSSSALRTFSLDKTAPEVLSLSVSNNKITWVISESGTSQIKIYTPALYLSRKIDTYPEVENNFYWEGIDGSGIEVPDSIYNFELTFTDDAEHTVSKSSQITKYGIPKITSGPNINYTESYAEIITVFSETAKDFILHIGEQRSFVLGEVNVKISGTEYKVLWDYKNSYGNKVINGSYKFKLTFMDLDNNIIKREGNITVNYGTPEVLLPEEGGLVDPQYGAIESATTLTDKIELKRTFTNTTGILPEDNTINILYQYGFYQPPPEPTEPTEFNITQYPPNKIKEEDGVYGFNISFSREIGEYVLKIANTKNNLMGVIQESENRITLNIPPIPDEEVCEGRIILKTEVSSFTYLLDTLGDNITFNTNLLPNIEFNPDNYTFSLEVFDDAGNKLFTSFNVVFYKEEVYADKENIFASSDGKAVLIVGPNSTPGVNEYSIDIADGVSPGEDETPQTGFDFLDLIYEIIPTPLGLEFSPPAELRLYYDLDKDGKVDINPDIPPDKLAIYYKTKVGEWQRLGGVANTDDEGRGYLSVYITHLSSFALVYPKDTIPPTVEITSPTSNSLVKETFNIIGTATDENFLKYKLLWGYGTEPTSWILFHQSNNKVINNILGSLDSQNLSDIFTVKLEAEDISHNISSTTVILKTKTDTTPPQITNISVEPNIFSPNNDGVKDTTTLNYNLSEKSYLTIKIYDKTDNLVHTLLNYVETEEGFSTIIWNGVGNTGDGIYTYRIEAEDFAGNLADIKTAEVKIDLTPPVTEIKIHDPRYTIQDKIYISENTKIELIASDPLVNKVASGVARTEYRVDHESWILYHESFTLQEGTRIVEYRSIDSVGNTETIKTFTLYVDNTPPITEIKIDAEKCFATDKYLVVNSLTEITLMAEDPIVEQVASGVKEIVYRVKGQESRVKGNEVTFTISDTYPDGEITIEYYAIDNVLNQHLTPNTYHLILDNTIPEIVDASDSPDPFSPNNETSINFKDTTRITAKVEDVNPCKFKVEVRDKGQGTRVKEFYGLGEEIDIIWDGEDELGEYVPDDVYEYIIYATDKAGNEANPLTGTVEIDNTTPGIKNLIVEPSIISPNNPTSINEKDETEITATISDKNLDMWLLWVESQSGNIMKSYAGTPVYSPQSIVHSWAGKDFSGSFVPDGIYTYYLAVFDKADNYLVQSGTITVDNTSPVITKLKDEPDPFSPKNKDSIKDEVEITAKLIEENPDEARCRIQDAGGKIVREWTVDLRPQTLDISISWDGTNTEDKFVEDSIYTYTVSSIDLAGNKATAVKGEVSIDNTEPITEIEIQDPRYTMQDKIIVSSKTEITIMAEDPVVNKVASGVKEIRYRIQDAGYRIQEGGEVTFTIPDTYLDDEITIEYYAVDNVSNQSPIDQLTITLDNTEPITEIISPQDNSVVNAQDVHIYGTASDLHFKEYKLEYGRGVEPDEWKEIVIVNGQQSIVNSELSVWNTATLERCVIELAGKAYAIVITPIGEIKVKVEGEGDIVFKWKIGELPKGVYSLRLTAVDVVENQGVSKISVLLGNPLYLGQVGKPGVGDGKFLRPEGVTVDTNNNIYVSDAIKSVIQKFNEKGEFLLRFGQLLTPHQLYTDSQNNIYVADTGNFRMQKFSSTGEPLLLFGSGGKNIGEFMRPKGIAVDNEGNIIASDTLNNRVQKFDQFGNFLLMFGRFGKDNSSFRYPQQVAVDDEGNIYIADLLNSRVQKFDKDGNYIMTFTIPQGTQLEVISHQSSVISWELSTPLAPQGVAIDKFHNVYVSDEATSRIYKFDPWGNLLLSFGRIGITKGNFLKPTGLYLDFNYGLYVANTNLARVDKFATIVGLGEPVLPPEEERIFTNLKIYPEVFSPNFDGKLDTTILTATVRNPEELDLIKIEILDSQNKEVKISSIEHPVSSIQYVWDGKSKWYLPVSSGTYTFRLSAYRNRLNPPIEQAEIDVIVDNIKPKFSGLNLSANPFSPNDDGNNDTTTLFYHISEHLKEHTIKVYSIISMPSSILSNCLLTWEQIEKISIAEEVKTLIDKQPTTAGDKNIAWDGTDDAGTYINNGYYLIRLTGLDKAENNAEPSAIIVQVDIPEEPSPDTTPPLLTNINVENVTEVTATIAWHTDERSTSQIEYGKTTSYGNKTNTNLELVNYHALTINNLTPATTYHFRALSKDAAGNEGRSNDWTFTTEQAPQAPTGSIVINNDAEYTRTASVALTLSAQVYNNAQVTSMCFSNDGIEWTQWENYIITKDWILTSGDGVKAVYVKFKDNLGSESVTYSDSIILDTTTPSISNMQVKDVTTNLAIVTWQTNELAKSKLYYGKTTNYGNTITDDNYITSHQIQLTNLQPATTYHFITEVIDYAGNTASSSDYFFTTYAAPTGSIVINNGAEYTNKIQVTLKLSARTTGLNYVAQMCFSNDGIEWTQWENWTTTKPWNLQNPDGIKVVYVKYKDNLNNESEICSDSIILDTTAPQLLNITVTNITANGATITWETNEEATSKVGYGLTMSYGSETSDAIFTQTHTLPISSLFEATTYHYRVKSTDYAGNTATSSDYTFTTLAPTKVSGSIVINDGVQYTNSTSVTLTLSASSTVGNVSAMQLSNDNINWSLWFTYATTKVWTLTFSDGSKTVYVKFEDDEGNVSNVYSDSIILDTTPPPAPILQSLPSPTHIAEQTVTGNAGLNTEVKVFINTQSQGSVTTRPDGTFSINITFSEGENIITAKATDLAGNASSESAPSTVILDTQLLTLTDLTLSPTSPVNAGNLIFTLTFSETMNTQVSPLITFGKEAPYEQHSVDNDKTWLDNKTYQAAFNITSTTGDGENTIKVKSAQDIAGNTMQEDTTYKFTIDTIAPAPPIIIQPTSPTNQQKITIEGEAEVGSTVEVFVNDNSAGTTTATSDGKFALSNVSLTEGENKIKAKVTDTAGNTSDFSTAITVVLDITPPTASITSPQSSYIINASTIVILGKATDEYFKNYQVHYGQGENPTDWSLIKEGTEPVPEEDILATWDTTGLSDIYTIKLVATDEATNTTEQKTVVKITQPLFLQKFGSFGWWNGAFNFPRGIDIDKDDNIDVADTFNHRIQKFDENGNHIFSFGSFGFFNGQFMFPSDVFVDIQDNIYVADTENNRIQKFDKDSNFLKAFGLGGIFNHPRGVYVDEALNIYVVERGAHRVRKLNQQGDVLMTIGGYGGEDGKFNMPRGIIVDSQDNIYVCDTDNNRLQIFDKDGNFINKITGLNGPIGIALDNFDNIYISTLNDNKIHKYDKRLNLLFTFGSGGSGDGQLSKPREIGLTQDNKALWVVDCYNHRLQKFALSFDTGVSKLLAKLREKEKPEIALEVKEAYNYPNPFNPNTEDTKIYYKLTKQARADIKVYDVVGRLVKTFDTILPGGPEETIVADDVEYRVSWNGRNDRGRMCANGVYVYYIEIKAGEETKEIIKKMSLLK